MKSKVNFHIHTTHSDGLDSVAEVVAGLKEAGVECFSITDHDSVGGLVEAKKLASENGLGFTNGVELSCFFDTEVDGLDFTYVAHILGYGFDIDKMANVLNELRLNKYAIYNQLYKKLVADGFALRKEKCLKNVPINYNKLGKVDCGEAGLLDDSKSQSLRDRFASHNLEDGVVTERKAIARELVEIGAAKNVDAAFNEILNTEPYVQYAKCLPSIRDGIKLIHECGGVIVAAHPFSTVRGGKHEMTKAQVEQYIAKLCEYGIEGIEVFYQAYNKEKIDFLSEQADKYGLIKTVATDYHGINKERAKSDKRYAQIKKSKGNYLFAFEKDGVVPCEDAKDYIACKKAQK